MHSKKDSKIVWSNRYTVSILWKDFVNEILLTMDKVEIMDAILSALVNRPFLSYANCSIKYCYIVLTEIRISNDIITLKLY